MVPTLLLVLSPLLRLALGSAHAAEGAVPPPDALPTAAPAAVTPLFLSRVWEEVAPTGTRAALVSISASPDNAERWLAADADGAVFLTDDAGARWTRVLEGVEADTVGAERLLLDAELLSADEFDDADSAEDDAGAAAVQRANETTSQVLGAHGDDGALPPCVWFDASGTGVALASRMGEIWRSTDSGASWERVDADQGATSFARVDDTLVAGAQDGVRASLDGGATWLDVDSAMQGSRVLELTAFGGAFYAATDGGLFRSPDALRWSRVTAAPDEPLVSVVQDPDYRNGYWLAAARGLYRTDDGGQTFYRFANQPLRGLRRMIHLPEAGHLLAISADGVWESTDAGVKWTPASRLLSDPDVRGLAMAEGTPVIATAGGVWRMVRPQVLGEDRAPEVSKPMPLADTVAIALDRAGLTGDMLALARRSAALPLIPTLTVQSSYNWKAGRDADFQVLSAAGTRDGSGSVTAQLCWGGCATSSSYYSYDSETYDVAQMVEDGQLTVIDGEIYDADAVVSAAANVAQSLASYRVSTAQQIGEAWITRARLADEVVPEASLRDQVMHLLAIQELDARLDAWTNGTFSTWKPESP